jgi:hypothetical protein
MWPWRSRAHWRSSLPVSLASTSFVGARPFSKAGGTRDGGGCLARPPLPSGHWSRLTLALCVGCARSGRGAVREVADGPAISDKYSPHRTRNDPQSFWYTPVVYSRRPSPHSRECPLHFALAYRGPIPWGHNRRGVCRGWNCLAGYPSSTSEARYAAIGCRRQG